MAETTEWQHAARSKAEIAAHPTAAARAAVTALSTSAASATHTVAKASPVDGLDSRHGPGPSGAPGTVHVELEVPHGHPLSL